MNYKEVDLYGGAMKAVLPSTYMDVRYIDDIIIFN